MTIRAPDELLDRVRAAAQRAGRSMNEYVTTVLRAVTDLELASDEASQVRERLASAGLLAPADTPRPRPDPERVAAARAAAGKGTPLAMIVSDDRS